MKSTHSFGQLFTCDGLAIIVASESTKCECIEQWMFMSLGKRTENRKQQPGRNNSIQWLNLNFRVQYIPCRDIEWEKKFFVLLIIYKKIPTLKIIAN